MCGRLEEALSRDSLFRLSGQLAVGVGGNALGDDGDEGAEVIENGVADIGGEGIQRACQLLRVMRIAMHYTHEVV